MRRTTCSGAQLAGHFGRVGVVDADLDHLWFGFEHRGEAGDQVLGCEEPPVLAQVQPVSCVDVGANVPELGAGWREFNESVALAEYFAVLGREAGVDDQEAPDSGQVGAAAQERVQCLFGAGAIGPGDQGDDDLGATCTGEQGPHQFIGVGGRRVEHRRYADVAVARNARPIVVGDVGSGQQLATQGERLGVLADPGRAHRLLVDGAPGIDVRADKQFVLGGKGDFRCALGEEVA